MIHQKFLKNEFILNYLLIFATTRTKLTDKQQNFVDYFYLFAKQKDYPTPDFRKQMQEYYVSRITAFCHDREMDDRFFGCVIYETFPVYTSNRSVLYDMDEAEVDDPIYEKITKMIPILKNGIIDHPSIN